MMAYLGIDAGSTYTKYCVLNQNAEIMALEKCRTRVRHDKSADGIIEGLRSEHPEMIVFSCGYGRNNVVADKTVSELIALAKGLHYAAPAVRAALDIGGQDTKAVSVDGGKLKRFYMNDKCAAGSGLFLLNTLNMLEMSLDRVEVSSYNAVPFLSSTCAVFAQTEIVNLMAEGAAKDDIINAVLFTILSQANTLLNRLEPAPETALTGGFTNILGIDGLFYDKFGIRLVIPKHGDYLSAIGCALYALEENY